MLDEGPYTREDSQSPSSLLKGKIPGFLCQKKGRQLVVVLLLKDENLHSSEDLLAGPKKSPVWSSKELACIMW